MTKLILFDSDVRNHLLPLTYSRPVGDLRIGILTIREKWEQHLRLSGSFLTDDSLRALFPVSYGDRNILVNGCVLPDEELAALVLDLDPGQAYRKDGRLIATCLDKAAVEALVNDDVFNDIKAFELSDYTPQTILRPADIFGQNAAQIRADYDLLTKDKTSGTPSATNTIIGPAENLFLEEGVTMEACVLNVTEGPIYLGKNSTLLEGALLRGPIALGERSTIKMGAKIYGGTTIGPDCKVGGEVSNVVFHGNSNKGHDGYLGNAVIGQWCNIGADTNASNLKNDYGEVRVWSYVEEKFADTGLQFHGLIMADHAKLAINTMLNTGTVIGFSANVYGEGFPRAFIPSFVWGGAGGMVTYRLDKAIATAERVVARRHQELTEADRALFTTLFEQTSKWRKWENAGK
ncbi:putative sugar nucleotidyl transferase [Neolewinella antarctica]|uniref:UDP-N-acetylglucosamine diphosphorylase/glucosamine-1-phosphate N-acetyltransferase n=1 Tax=Neolewinella antarctica TaxID=442734 RepID=A0ABX0XC64_9BACT|nr:putative sugar nucleotidyl transferase [Neolewinella antarctica]NJC26845.1 UDP-N-acetylglucosamine diphosphorylase/glucosamine-1-phosphate N-acetyltransferase [Neolewinella antarctica]